MVTGERTDVEFFFIDTNPFVESYWMENNKDYIWQLAMSREDYIAHELKVSCSKHLHMDLQRVDSLKTGNCVNQVLTKLDPLCSCAPEPDKCFGVIPC